MAERAPATAGTVTGVTAVDMAAAEDAAGGKQSSEQAAQNAQAEREPAVMIAS
jgi:hypothetical protein